jgi:hypothetical protein
MDMHAGSLQFQWLTFTGGNLTVTCLHPLGSNIQFHNLLFDPTDLNLLDTIVKDFGTSQSPKSTRLRDSHCCPGRPAFVPLRHTIASLGAGSAALPQMARRDVRMATLFPLRRFATPGKQCALIASGDYRPSLRSPWPAAKVSGCFRTELYANAYCRISSYLQTMANQGHNPLIAIQMALAGEIPQGCE